jgi:putative ABC transport system permease protein
MSGGTHSSFLIPSGLSLFPFVISMRTLLQDLKYAFRLFRRAPLFTAIAIATLALGIGATTGVFSVVDGVLLRPLPYSHPDRLVAVHWTRDVGAQQSFSAADFLDFSRQSRSVAAMAALRDDVFTLGVNGVPTQIDGVLVSPAFFDVFGTHPLVGRLFNASDATRGAHLVVLSEGLWRQQFGADPQVVGRAIQIDQQAATIVGVVSASFTWPQAAVKLWALAPRGVPAPPMQVDGDYLTQHGVRYLDVVGRLREGVALPAAEGELAAIGHRLAQDYPDDENGLRASLTPLREQLVGNVRPVLLVLMGAVSILLLIACINVANLLLARGAGRAREIGIRAALGASRWRLVRQLVTESVLLSMAGGAAGLLLAAWITDGLVRLAPSGLPRLDAVHVDLGVAAFAVLAAIATGMLFGSVPAWQVSKTGPAEALQAGNTRSVAGGHRISNAMVVAQVALSLMLLIAAGLMARSLYSLMEQDPGFDPARVVSADVILPSSRYQTNEQQVAFYERFLDRLQAQGPMKNAAIVFPLPLASGGSAHASFTIAGRPPLPADVHPSAGMNIVSPGYFHVMHIPLLQGRALTDEDRLDGSPTHGLVINRTMSRQYWPNQNPLGAKVDLGFTATGEDKTYFTVVGVVADTRTGSLQSAPGPEIYLSYREFMLPFMTAVVRTDAGTAGVATALRSAIAGIDPDLGIGRVRPMPDVLSRAVSQPRLRALVLGAFAVLALVLASIGIYGLVSYSVATRTREFGIRLALGAERGSVISLVLGGGLRVLLLGVAIGLAGAWAATRVMSGLLYGVTATDPLTYAALAALLVAVGVLASYIPARRATRVDPLTALRSE